MKKRIFVIDDEIDILEAVKIILQNAGYDVSTQTEFSSLTDISRFDPDLIILDVLLVGDSGKDICKKIKGNKNLKDTPVLLLSAHPASQLKKLTEDCGATSFLPKPFDIDVLLAVIEKMLR